MLIRDLDQVESSEMTMPGAEKVTMRLMVGRADGAPNFAMRCFDVEPGGCTPFHNHNYEHEILIVQGQGKAVQETECGEKELTPIKAGDVLFVQPNEMHQFRNDSSETLRFMCMVPTQFDCSSENTGDEAAMADTPGS